MSFIVLTVILQSIDSFLIHSFSSRSHSLQLNDFGEVKKVEVCTIEKYCKRKGSAKIWKLFQELAPVAGIELEESECFFECQTGPNIRLDGDDKRIHGAIKSEEMVRKVLGLGIDEEI